MKTDPADTPGQWRQSWRRSLTDPALRPAEDRLLFFAFGAAIPAFYLLLTTAPGQYRHIGSALYLLSAVLITAAIALSLQRTGYRGKPYHLFWIDVLLVIGAFGSAWPGRLPWTTIEWWLRLAFCAVILLRITPMTMRWVMQRHLTQILVIATSLLAIAGGGFYWLEPKIDSYADGLWLAFITAATVGYGDLVPSTPASRVFAVFIVLLGYAIFSLVTASIAALFVGEDEQGLETELHGEIQTLRGEIQVLRDEIERLRRHFQ